MRPILIVALLALLTSPAAAETDWSGLTVVITGANRGIGLEFARQLHEAGATVIGTARKPAAADELNALGVRVEQLDVTDPESVAGKLNARFEKCVHPWEARRSYTLY